MTNQRKLILYIATSLDGFIAREDESLDWLFRAEGEGDNGYSDFYETVDTILMGRRTYDWIKRHEGDNFPYPNKECFVFTRSSAEMNENVTFINEDIVSFTTNLKNKTGKNIWLVGGGELLHEFLKMNLIDEIVLTIAPSIIGKGVPLFKHDDYELQLSLKGIKRYNQFAELHYEVKQ